MDAVYRLSFAILGDETDARDAAQETFVAAWRQIGRLRDPEKFDAWFQKVAVNAARMVARARGRRGVREIAATRLRHAVEAIPENNPAAADARRLDAALRRLPVGQRSILVLHHLDGRSIAELGEIFGIPPGTVKSRLHTARAALQVALEADR